MRKSVVSTGIFCLAVGMFAAGSRAQVPLVKLWVTEVYEVNPDGTYTPKCGDILCPSQDLLPGIAQPGDLINIEVKVEGWDEDVDTGICDRTFDLCSVSAQNCADFFCTNGGGPCATSSECFAGQTCERVVCNKSPLLGAFQWTVDSSTYSNGGAPGLKPAEVACDTSADCACAYTATPGDFNDCADFAALGLCSCSGASCQDDGTCSLESIVYLDESPGTNWLYDGHASVEAVSTASLDFAVGAASNETSGGVPEQLFRCSGGTSGQCNRDEDCAVGTCELSRTSPYYLGTLLLQATTNACGLFTIDLVGDPDSTFFRDAAGAPLPAPLIEALTIDFGAAVPCDDGDACTVNDRSCGGNCVGEPIVCNPGETCIGGVCQSECSFANLIGAVWSDGSPLADDPFDRPGNCAIDARQPHDLNNAALTEGWDRLILQFSCDPTALAAGFTPTDFPRSTAPISLAPFLFQSGIIPNAADKTVTLKLSRQISPSFYTCIAHPDSGNQWCAGYLPADSSQDELSTASDINALINSLNNVPGFALPEYATDIDRSTVTNSQDILRLIDLLNGAGQLDVWLAAGLPACPSAP